MKRLRPYKRVISDRLHGAIISILMRKQTALLPVAYHKNSSFYDTWFSDLAGISFLASENDIEEFSTEDSSPDFDFGNLFYSIASKGFASFLLHSAKAASSSGSYPV